MKMKTLSDSISLQGSTKNNSTNTRFLKYFSLVALVFQLTFIFILIRVSRKNREGEVGPAYLASSVVLFSELLKLLLCCLIIFIQLKGSLEQFIQRLKTDLYDDWKEFAKMIVPAFLFNLQNNLSFLALSHLDAATFQILSQLKILTTALISVLLLNTKLDKIKWASLVILVIGVSTVEFQKSFGLKTDQTGNSLIGLITVIIICFSSGFSTVYFEKLLKSSSISIWMRNIQLSFFGVVFGLINALIIDGEQVKVYGLLHGYSMLIWVIVLLSALGGLLIASVIAYADNIIKGFAVSISIISSTLISYLYLNDLVLSKYFMIGSALILISVFLYNKKSSASA